MPQRRVPPEEPAAPPVRRGRKPRSAEEIAQVVAPGMRRGKHRKPGPLADDDQAGDGDRQFVVALARGLGVLAAFKVKDGPLGNRELAERTGVPATTISRITHTLTRLGYLSFDARRETYELGGSALALGHTALARLNVRRVALAPMQRLAQRANANVGLGMRERHTMLYAETCEGAGPVGLRLFPGSRIPIATSAMGRAYLAALPAHEREALLDDLAPQHGEYWPQVREGVEQALRDVTRLGFCSSLGAWQRDIHGVAVPIVEPATGRVYAINLGGPAYMLPPATLLGELGPQLVAVRDEILASLGALPA